MIEENSWCRALACMYNQTYSWAHIPKLKKKNKMEKSNIFLDLLDKLRWETNYKYKQVKDVGQKTWQARANVDGTMTYIQN